MFVHTINRTLTSQAMTGQLKLPYNCFNVLLYIFDSKTCRIKELTDQTWIIDKI